MHMSKLVVDPKMSTFEGYFLVETKLLLECQLTACVIGFLKLSKAWSMKRPTTGRI